MDIPGTESDYKKELNSSLTSEYAKSRFSSSCFEIVYKKDVDGLVSDKTIYIGLIDERSITPESLDKARGSLESQISDSYSFWEHIGHAHHIVIVAVTNNVSSDTRRHIKNQDMIESGKYMQEMVVVDVSAGTIVENESRRHSRSVLDDLKRNHLQEPFGGSQDLDESIGSYLTRNPRSR